MKLDFYKLQKKNGKNPVAEFSGATKNGIETRSLEGVNLTRCKVASDLPFDNISIARPYIFSYNMNPI